VEPVAQRVARRGTGQRTMIAQDDQFATSNAPVEKRAGLSAVLRRISANFWIEFLFWWTEHAPRVVWHTRGFFLPLAWFFGKQLRENTLANARGVLGDSADEKACVALAKSMIRSFYIAVYELGCALRSPREELKRRVDSVEGRDAYDLARKSRRGAVIVTAHLGSFELGSAALVDRERRMHVVFRRDASSRFDRLRSRLRERLGVVEAPVDEGWSMWTRLLDALASDEVVLIQGDRVMSGQKGVAIPFLARHLPIPAGPFKLALAASAPIIPVFSFRTTVGRLRIVVEEPIMVHRDDGPFDGRHPAMLKLANLIMKHVRNHAEQWLMVEPLWSDNGSDHGGTKHSQA